MYRIGKFAAVTGLSIKGLRFYDEIGLLKPALVDRESGYRLYFAEQAQRAATIAQLRRLGFSLSEVARFLASSAPEREVLQAARERLLQSMTRTQNLLEEVDSRLAMLGRGAQIRVRKLPAAFVASRRGRVESAAEADELLRQLETDTKARREASRGLLWHQCAHEGFLEAEAFVEVPQTFRRRGHYELKALSGARAACALALDDEAQAEQVYLSLRKWLPENGYTLAGAKREIVRNDRGGRFLEIQFPIGLAQRGERVDAKMPA